MTKDAILKKFEEFFPKHEGDHMDGQYWYIDMHDEEIRLWVEEMKKFLLSSLDEVERESYKRGWENCERQSLSCLCDCHVYSTDKRHCINCDFKTAPSSEKLPKEKHE